MATAEELLTGPLGGTDMIGVRRLRRGLRIAEHEGGSRTAEIEGDELLVAAVQDPRELILLEPHVAGPRRSWPICWPSPRETVIQELSAEDALWEVWKASGLSDRWTQLRVSAAARAGGQADRDLDAVVNLFDYVAKFVDRLPQAGVEVFVDDLMAQEIPADSLAAQAPDGEAVRILTAHRSKGLEWDVVVAAGVQEGVWPDLRVRGSLLGVEIAGRGLRRGRARRHRPGQGRPRLQDAGRGTPAVLRRRHPRPHQDRRHRGRRRGRRGAPLPVPQRARRPAAWRSATVDDRARWAEHARAGRRPARGRLRPHPAQSSMRARRRPPSRPARRRGRAGAHPEDLVRPHRDLRRPPLGWPDGVVQISPSAVEKFTKCGLRWILETAVGTGGESVPQVFGNVIHAIAVLAAEEHPPTSWPNGSTTCGTNSTSAASGSTASSATSPRRWSTASSPGTARTRASWSASRSPFTQVVSDGVVIKGRVDRVERDGEGRAVIIDIKTGTAKPRDDELDRHPQLGVYQLATVLGAFERHGMTEPRRGRAAPGRQGGRHGPAGQGAVADPLRDDVDPEWAQDLVTTVAAGMSANLFVAKVNDGCRTCAARLSCPVNDGGGQVC